MTRLEAALHVLFADNLDDLETEHDRYDVAKALGVRIDHTNHWSELRGAAKSYMIANLSAMQRKVESLPPQHDIAIWGPP